MLARIVGPSLRWATARITKSTRTSAVTRASRSRRHQMLLESYESADRNCLDRVAEGNESVNGAVNAGEPKHPEMTRESVATSTF